MVSQRKGFAHTFPDYRCGSSKLNPHEMSGVRVRASLRANETAPLVGIAMKASYRHAFEATNQFVRI
jgi:hypothetical protein